MTNEVKPSDIPFKYVGDEKYVELFETSQRKCSSCGLLTPAEQRLTKAAVTYFEVTRTGENKIRFFGTLNGHKIVDRIVEEPCRWSWA